MSGAHGPGTPRLSRRGPSAPRRLLLPQLPGAWIFVARQLCRRRGIEITDLAAEGDRLRLDPGALLQIDAAPDGHRQGRCHDGDSVAADEDRGLHAELC